MGHSSFVFCESVDGSIALRNRPQQNSAAGPSRSLRGEGSREPVRVFILGPGASEPVVDFCEFLPSPLLVLVRFGIRLVMEGDLGAE